jgi:dienelactone hydrolase
MKPATVDTPAFRAFQSRIFELYSKDAYREALDLALANESTFPDQAGRMGFWIACLHSRLGELDSAVQALRSKLASGYWWSEERMLQDEDLAPLQGRDDFRSVLVECAARRREAQKEAKPSIAIQAPAESAGGRVPLLMALHGRDGRGEDFAPHWEGATALGWLLALPTSSQILSPYGFGWDDRELAERDVGWGYEQTRAAHVIDSGRVVIAGFSQGGAAAIRMALKGDAVPARGFLVVAPSAIREPPDVIGRWGDAAAKSGVRGWIYTGERDYALASTKDLHERLVAGGMAVDFTVESNLGHEFPRDFSNRLVSALRFLVAE